MAKAQTQRAAAWPVLPWLAHYRRRWLRADLVAGLTSWALVVPQAVAYGQIAGLAPPAGLAAAFAGPLGYSLLGTSRQLMVSPTSSTAAISAAIVGTMAAGDPVRFVALSATLALVIGATFALLGLFRLGFVSQFLAFSVQTGFMFGLGLTIAVGQLPKVLGISAPTDESFLPGLAHLLTHLGETNGWTALLGLGGLGAMVLLNRYAPRLPAALAVVAAGTALTALLDLTARGVATVGAIPAGLPPPAIPDVSVSDVLALVPVAVVMAVLGYAESASVAQDLATRHGYDVDPDRELLAIGAANGLAGLLGGFMVAGGASQSAANDRAGARTQAAGLLVAVLALVTALFLTPLFFDLPEAVLGAIVLFAIMGFFRIGELRRIARLRRDSFAGALVTLIGVLVLGVLPGLILAVGLSIVNLLTRAARPGCSLIGRATAEGAPADGAPPAVYGDLTQNAALRPVPGLLIVRPNAPLFFGNVRAVRQQVLDLARHGGAPAGAGPLPDAPHGPPERAVLLDLQMSPNMDVETADTLAQLRTALAGEGRTLWLGGVHDSGRTLLLRAGYAATLAEGRIFPDAASAVHAFEHRPAPAPAGHVEQ